MNECFLFVCVERALESWNNISPDWRCGLRIPSPYSVSKLGQVARSVRRQRTKKESRQNEDWENSQVLEGGFLNACKPSDSQIQTMPVLDALFSQQCLDVTFSHFLL